MASDETLTTAFAEVGKAYGFDRVNAEYAQFKDFKLRWQRSEKWAEFEVSDYLKGADEQVLCDLATSVFKRIKGEECEGYGRGVTEYVTDAKFLKNNQRKFMRRCRNCEFTGIGEHHNLNNSLARLVQAGLVRADTAKDIKLGWKADRCSLVAGHASVLFKTVVINKDLDSDVVSDDVMDGLVYHYLARILVGFDPENKHQADYLKLLDRYSKKAECDRFVECSRYYYNN